MAKNNNLYQSGRSGNNNPVLKDAKAPFNFVEYEPKAALPAWQGSDGHLSGVIKCELTARTPFLIAEKQTDPNDQTQKPGECSFLQVNGRPVIPGSSIKGMLRFLVEILSFSEMSPISEEPLFYRMVNTPDFPAKFKDPDDEGKILGGYLRKFGADYQLTPVRVTAIPWNEEYKKDYEKGRCRDPRFVPTGGITTRGKHSCAYSFAAPDHARAIDLDRELVLTLERQMTEDQQKRWHKNKLTSQEGHPVFYRLDKNNGEIAELGQCRIFRLAYKFAPASLPYLADGHVGTDFANELFGYIGDKSKKGKVAIASAFVEGKPARPETVILGGPKPTCLPLYVDQSGIKITVRNNGDNLPTSFLDYNDDKSNKGPTRLRGRKLYWHHQVVIPQPEGKQPKYKVQTVLHPMNTGSTAKIEIHVRNLTELELGCLLEAIDLPKNCQHHLGMGKPLGFGSVSLAITAIDIEDNGKRYHSLLERMTGQPAPVGGDELAAMRENFKRTALALVQKRFPQWAKYKTYAELPPIAQLYLMLDARNPRDKSKAAYMVLDDFRRNALLEKPEVVAK